MNARGWGKNLLCDLYNYSCWKVLVPSMHATSLHRQKRWDKTFLLIVVDLVFGTLIYLYIVLPASANNVSSNSFEFL